ncbi:uncharacterized protein [Haliotis cracherodii]|uniref:uncharacterized protein n=1 Tax=Haliotis cracherodii TaxID=6455 RepID=UPI0039EB991E
MAQNEKAANLEMLKELRIRSLIASFMMYEQSTKYGSYVFLAVIVIGVLIGAAVAILSTFIPVGDADNQWVLIFKIFIGWISGTATTFQTGRIFLLEYFEKKEKLDNETAAGWQKLELDIRLFLNSIEKTSNKSLRKFISDCIQQRHDICFKSKPDGDTYEKYHARRHLTINKYQKKQLLIAHIGQRLDYEEEEDTELIVRRAVFLGSKPGYSPNVSQQLQIGRYQT